MSLLGEGEQPRRSETGGALSYSSSYTSTCSEEDEEGSLSSSYSSRMSASTSSRSPNSSPRRRRGRRDHHRHTRRKGEGRRDGGRDSCDLSSCSSSSSSHLSEMRKRSSSPSRIHVGLSIHDSKKGRGCESMMAGYDREGARKDKTKKRKKKRREDLTKSEVDHYIGTPSKLLFSLDPYSSSSSGRQKSSSKQRGRSERRDYSPRHHHHHRHSSSSHRSHDRRSSRSRRDQPPYHPSSSSPSSSSWRQQSGDGVREKNRQGEEDRMNSSSLISDHKKRGGGESWSLDFSGCDQQDSHHRHRDLSPSGEKRNVKTPTSLSSSSSYQGFCLPEQPPSRYSEYSRESKQQLYFRGSLRPWTRDSSPGIVVSRLSRSQQEEFSLRMRNRRNLLSRGDAKSHGSPSRKNKEDDKDKKKTTKEKRESSSSEDSKRRKKKGDGMKERDPRSSSSSKGEESHEKVQHLQNKIRLLKDQLRKINSRREENDEEEGEGKIIREGQITAPLQGINSQGGARVLITPTTEGGAHLFSSSGNKLHRCSQLAVHVLQMHRRLMAGKLRSSETLTKEICKRKYQRSTHIYIYT